jgi:hypothetical protein
MSKTKTSSFTTYLTLSDLPHLVDEMLHSGDDEKCEIATKEIYHLCDIYHKENRIPMVCSGFYDVLTPLAISLKQTTGTHRHISCLALNNLSIPFENKSLMALGPASKEIFGGLCRVIADDKEDCFLGILCLMNLSQLEDCITKMLYFSPNDENCFMPPLSNPNSLVRILESILTRSPHLISSLEHSSASTVERGANKSSKSESLLDWLKTMRGMFVSSVLILLSDPYQYHQPHASKTVSHKSEKIRWTYSLLKNLSRCDQNADLIGRTKIPQLVVTSIASADQHPASWNRGSVEDFSLSIVLNLSQYPVSRAALLNSNVVDVIAPIMHNTNHFQGLKATISCIFLNVTWSKFPSDGVAASVAVSESMTDVYEKQMKQGAYDCATIKLTTITKAFCDLTSMAARHAATESCLQILTNPANIAICLQIISENVLFKVEDTTRSMDTLPEDLPSSHVVKAIEVMIPFLLKASITHDQPDEAQDCIGQSDKALLGISELLSSYADLTGSSEGAIECAYNAAIQIKESVGTFRPILVKAYALWQENSEI